MSARSIDSSDCYDSKHPMYTPKGKLLAWLREVHNDSPGKYAIRKKQRDPFNTGNKDRKLYDREVITAVSINELLEELLKWANHMSSDIMYLTTPKGDTIYARDTASGGFSVDKYILGIGDEEE